MLSGGEKEAFERARKKESEALRRLTREAEKLLRKRGSGSSSLLNQVTESLRASAIFPTGRELLARGRFQQPMKPAGFEVVGELAGTARPGTDRKTQKADAAERHEASEALKDARRRHRDAEKQARQAAQKAERLQTQASDATSAAQEAKELARAAALELQQAEIRLERTKRS